MMELTPEGLLEIESVLSSVNTRNLTVVEVSSARNSLGEQTMQSIKAKISAFYCPLILSGFCKPQPDRIAPQTISR